MVEVETTVVEVEVDVEVIVDVGVADVVVVVVVVVSAATGSAVSSVGGVMAPPMTVTVKDTASTHAACFRVVTPNQPRGRTRLIRPKRSPPRPRSPSRGPIGCR